LLEAAGVIFTGVVGDVGGWGLRHGDAGLSTNDHDVATLAVAIEVQADPGILLDVAQLRLVGLAVDQDL